MQSWETIAQYLEERRENEIKTRKIFATIQLISAIALYIFMASFTAAYMTVIIWALSYNTCFLISVAFIAILFFIHTRLYSPDDPFLHQASDSPFGMIEIFLRVILFGVPILFRSGIQNIKAISNYNEADFESCARIFDYLKDQEKGIPIEELKDELPFLDLDALLPDLLLVDGFLFLHDAERLTLTDTFKTQLKAL